MFAFGEADSRDKAIAPSLEGERAGEGEGNQDGNDGDGDSMTSSDGIDSM